MNRDERFDNEDEIDETGNWPMIIGAILLVCVVGALAIFGGS